MKLLSWQMTVFVTRWIISTSIFVSLLACQQNVEDKPRKASVTPVQDNSGEKRLVQNFGRFDIKCASGNSCPQGIGVLLIKTKDGLARCTAQLANGEITTTNRHCVEDLIEGPCSNSIVFQLAQDQGLGRVAFCREIKYTSSPTDKFSDLAVIHLDRSLINDASMLPGVATKTVQENDELFSYVVDSRKDYYGMTDFMVNRRECRAVFGTALADFQTAPYARSFMLAGDKCQFIKGNSGSAVYNSEGQVVGIAFAGPKLLDTWEQISQRSRQGQTLTELQNIKTDYGIAMNFTCADVPALGIYPHSQCPTAEGLRKAENDRLKSLTEKAFANLNQDPAVKRFNEQAEVMSSTIDYKPISKNAEIYKEQLEVGYGMQWEPKCYKPELLTGRPNNPVISLTSEWSTSFTTGIRKVSVLTIYTPELFFVLRYGFDERGRGEFKLSRIGLRQNVFKRTYTWDEKQKMFVNGRIETLLPEGTRSPSVGDFMRAPDRSVQKLFENFERSTRPDEEKLWPVEEWWLRVPQLKAAEASPKPIANLGVCNVTGMTKTPQ